MKVALFLCLAVVAAAVGAPVEDKYVVPKGVDRFMQLLKMVQHGRIVGGKEVEPGSRPFQVGIFLTLPDGIGFCGGALISSIFVLTAAHCVKDVTDFEVVLGAHNIKDPNNLRIQSSKAIVYDQWYPDEHLNDVALIELPIDVYFTDTIKPIELPTISQERTSFKDYASIASGWGIENDGNTDISNNLRAVAMNVISNEECDKKYPGRIIPTHICTSGERNRSTCDGDSGGPLTLMDEGKIILVGIVSSGFAPECGAGWPSVYTRVSYFWLWIQKITGIMIRP